MNFLCGCSMPSFDSLRGDPELHTMDTVEYDAEGFLICSVHRQRRYGWRSLPILDGPNGRRIDYDVAGMDELEIEKMVVFGYPPVGKPFGDFKVTVKDKRDNRDPVMVAREREAAKG